MTVDDVIVSVIGRVLAPVYTELTAIRAELAALRAAQPARLVSVRDAAAEMGISPCSVRRHIADRTLPSRRIGARVLVDMTAARPASDDEIAARACAAGEARP